MENKNKTNSLPIIIGIVVAVVVILAIVTVSKVTQKATTTDTTTATTESLTSDSTDNINTTIPLNEVITSNSQLETTATTTDLTTLETTTTTTESTSTTTLATLPTTTMATTTTSDTITTEPPISIPTGTYDGAEPFSRATLIVYSESDTVYLSVRWADGAFAYSLWTMSGTFNANTNTVEYSNGSNEYVEIDPDTYEESTTVQSSTESGYFEFDTGGAIYWVPNSNDTLAYYDESSITFYPSSDY